MVDEHTSIFSSTIGTLKDVLGLLLREGFGTNQIRLFSDEGLRYLSVLGGECAIVLAKNAPTFVKAGVRKERKTARKNAEKPKVDINTPVVPTPFKLDEERFLNELDKIICYIFSWYAKLLPLAQFSYLTERSNNQDEGKAAGTEERPRSTSKPTIQLSPQPPQLQNQKYLSKQEALAAEIKKTFGKYLKCTQSISNSSTLDTAIYPRGPRQLCREVVVLRENENNYNAWIRLIVGKLGTGILPNGRVVLAIIREHLVDGERRAWVAHSYMPDVDLGSRFHPPHPSPPPPPGFHNALSHFSCPSPPPPIAILRLLQLLRHQCPSNLPNHNQENATKPELRA
ncbi:0669884a-595e-4370-8482-0c2b090fdcee [Sclerotinia trifoliorum]|uniref:0669884a-595e-4370-8482-0c2b090fdcee n=1 Tax=Sclerotinia trifoliorum TaxID=28548 RepID=A0A8H2W3S4_9HELO|nr:0669884a-595e-4370-8482-0c2b090fdcee [Sclerotinia trifoliorum]